MLSCLNIYNYMPSITTTDDTLITSTHDGDLQCAIDDTRDFDNATVAHCFLFGTESFMTGFVVIIILNGERGIHISVVISQS